MSEPARVELAAVQIGAEDLDRAADDYLRLLGIEPVRTTAGGWRFQLQRGAVELEAAEPGSKRGLRALSFALAPPQAGQAIDWPSDPRNFHGLEVRLTLEVDPPVRIASDPSGASPFAIDHVVINTPDLDRAIGLWRDRLGLRLALDREFPSRGLRMAFFRSGGMTLELVATLGPAVDPTAPDQLWGVAYPVGDLAACRERLALAGLDVSPVRPGQKPGTSVVTVRSGTCGVATLLIQPALGTPESA